MERRLNFKYQTTEQNDPFESALSSMVSSPTGERSNGGDFILGGCDHGMMMELIGRLGCMSESTTANNSTNTSCYTTPLNSPPKVSSISSYMIMAGGGSGGGVNLPNFHADPGFVERAAKFSSFGLNRGGGGGGGGDRSGVNLECGKLSGSSLDHGDVGDSREGSSVSEQNHVVGQMGLIDGNCRKRKSFSKSKAKDNDNKAEQEDEKSNAKRSKANYEEGKKQNGGECDNNNNNNNNNSKEVAKAEPAKDYIHVRARRGQATDSHSLAERVRREKISERMKFLQDLVPGCNKVIGKATVLDEIINYVQSLQHQVEFLSMKLATFNPRIEFNPQNLVSKHVMFESKGQIMYKLEQTSAQPFTHNYQPFQHFPNGNEHPFSTNPSIPLTCSITGFGDSITQMPNFWENDLQSIVQMGILQNQTQSLPGTSPNAPMKVEL